MAATSSNHYEHPGLKSGDAADLPDDMYYGTSVATSSPSVRTGFIRKVYGILTAQLALTTAICALFMYVTPLRNAIIAAGGILQIILMVASIATIFALMASKDSYPANMYLLGAFTVVESILVGYICALYKQRGLGVLVLEALGLTLLVFSSITAYCFVSGKDFSFMGGALFSCLCVLFAASVINLFLGITGNRSPFFSMLIACGGALLFSLYILYDSTLLRFSSSVRYRGR